MQLVFKFCKINYENPKLFTDIQLLVNTKLDSYSAIPDPHDSYLIIYIKKLLNPH